MWSVLETTGVNADRSLKGRISFIGDDKDPIEYNETASSKELSPLSVQGGNWSQLVPVGTLIGVGKNQNAASVRIVILSSCDETTFVESFVWFMGTGLMISRLFAIGVYKGIGAIGRNDAIVASAVKASLDDSSKKGGIS